MIIHPDVWKEFMLYAQVLYRVNPESTVYDVFMILRQENGNQPFSAGFIKKIDYEIKQEEKRNAKYNQK